MTLKNYLLNTALGLVLLFIVIAWLAWQGDDYTTIEEGALHFAEPKEAR